MDIKDITVDVLNEHVGGKYPLTERQFLFVMRYAQHHIGMLAIREAGYSHSTPGSQSSAANKLLRNERVQKAIEFVKSIGGDKENERSRTNKKINPERT